MSHDNPVVPATWPYLAMKWSRREVPGGDLALMVWMERLSGMSSMRAVRLLVTNTSYGLTHSGNCASCTSLHDLGRLDFDGVSCKHVAQDLPGSSIVAENQYLM